MMYRIIERGVSMIKKLLAWLLLVSMVANLLPAGVTAISETEDNLREVQETRYEIVPDESTDFSDNMKTVDKMTVPSEYDTSATSAHGVVRYTVLLLDLEAGFTMTQNDEEIYNVSTPMDTVKKAATRFVEQISAANGTNYVAIVSYGKNSYVDCGFTTSKSTLLDTIESLDVLSGVANMTAAYEDADELLQTVEHDNAIKNVVMFSQGIPGAGNYNSYGEYDKDDCSWYNSGTGVYIYQYANAVYAKATDMMERYNLYSIGLFQQFDEVPEAGRSLLEFAMMHAEDIQNKGYQCIDDVDDLEFAFGEVADDLSNFYREKWIKNHIDYAMSDEFKRDVRNGWDENMSALFTDVKEDWTIDAYNTLDSFNHILGFDLNAVCDTAEYELLLAQILFDRQGEQNLQNLFVEKMSESLIELGDMILEGNQQYATGRRPCWR